ncbi:hypothetical protein Vretimale_2432 [Volvox reticuliferus]|uniref:Uncharacterized protein n=1 Tax=Volvox reticuliferus TaxID=1737510 RepID=A0A8J4FG25_9CHLO|nr:hypothetical protein Vretifemale_4717 [Volvox reticuliferus]GIL96673.1 hypothetical protein Vretimale_2432 [Volvox reticuliferus]
MLMFGGLLVLLAVCLGCCHLYLPAWATAIAIGLFLLPIILWIKMNPPRKSATSQHGSRKGNIPPVMGAHLGDTSSAGRTHTGMTSTKVLDPSPSKDDAHKESPWLPANHCAPATAAASPETAAPFAACNSSSSQVKAAIKSCCMVNMKAPAFTADTATALAPLNARRVALNAKLAGHPMPNLVHYNRAMELTRQIDKHLSYPAPYARGRSAYKIPSGEPEYAPEGWRDQITQAMVSAGGKANGGGDNCSRDDGTKSHDYVSRGSDDEDFFLDAAYLRHGCIMLVVEYSRRRCTPYAYGAGVLYGHMKTNASESQETVIAAAEGCSGDDVAEGSSADSVQKAATAFGPLLPVPVLSYQDLLQAFGPQLLQPKGLPVQVGVQHLVGEPFIAGDSDQVRPQTLSPEAMQLFERGTSGLASRAEASPESSRATSAAADAFPSIALLGHPCVLASDWPLHLPVLVLARPSSPGPDAGGAISSESGSVTPTGETATIPAMLEPQPQLPRLLARYGCLDAAPQPCRVVSRPADMAVKEGDWFFGDLVAPTAGIASVGISENEIDKPDLEDLRHLGQIVGKPSGVDYLCVVLGPCPKPGMILLEMDVHTVAAEEEDAAQQAESNRVPCNLPTVMASKCAPLLSWPLPVVVVDDPSVQREVNAIAAAAKVATDASATEGNIIVAAEMVDHVSTCVVGNTLWSHEGQRLAPAWLHAFLYDLGQFLELAEAGRVDVSTRIQGGAAPQCSSAGDEAGGLSSGGRIEQRSLNSSTIIEGMEADSDASSWSAVDGGVDRKSGRQLGDGDDEERLLCLAASLAAYACRQGLPSLLSCVLSRTDRAGIPLLLLNEQVEVLSGGLGLAHLAVLSGNAELMEALLLQARTMVAALLAMPPSLQVRGAAAAAAAMQVAPSCPGHAISADCFKAACRDRRLQLHTAAEDAENGVSYDGMDGRMGCQLASTNGCTALFVRPGPGGVTPLHLVALMHKRSPDLAQPLMSLCPLAAHAWFGVQDAGGISAAQYSLRAGAGELNEQCEELLVMEALEAEVLGCDEHEKVLATAIKTALQVANLPPEPLAAAETTQPTLRGTQNTTFMATSSRYSGPHFEASAVDGARAAAAISGATKSGLQVSLLPTVYQAPAHFTPPQPSSPGGPCNGSSDSRRMPNVLRCRLADAICRCATSAKHLPWAAPLCGFPDPSLERAFASRARILALQRNRFALAFHLVAVAGCVQKFLVMQAGTSPQLTHGPLRPGTPAVLSELLIAVGAPTCKLLGNVIVLAWRLQSAAHDFTLISFAVLQGMILGAVHLSGRQHPEAFEVADLAMQEALVSLYHCVIIPVMEQTIDPLRSLYSAVICTLMELPMAVNHGWHGPMAAGLLAIRFVAGMVVRYSLAVWARASYLKGATGGSSGRRAACGLMDRCRCSRCGDQCTGKCATPDT